MAVYFLRGREPQPQPLEAHHGCSKLLWHLPSLTVTGVGIRAYDALGPKQLREGLVEGLLEEACLADPKSQRKKWSLFKVVPGWDT